MEAFWDRGFESISMEELTEATGLSRSSIYAAYESKRGLFAAALNFYMDNRVDFMLGGLEGHDADLDTVLAFFEMFEDAAAEYPDRYALGCLLTNTMTELGHDDPAIRASGTAYLERLRSAFANAVRSASSGEEEAEERAAILATVTLGSFVAARGSDPGIISPLATASALVGAWRVS